MSESLGLSEALRLVFMGCWLFIFSELRLTVQAYIPMQ